MRHILLAARMQQLAPVALVLISVAVAIGSYLQALSFPFISDDNFYVVYNTNLVNLRPSDLWQLMVKPYNPYEFLPLRDLSYWIDMAISGLNPMAFRISNVLFYLLCCWLVYGVTLGLWRYFKPREAGDASWVAAIVTALFALHPAHVESIVWISSRKDVLSGMFAMLALWLAVNARRELGLSPIYAGLTLVALLAAMLSKATTIVVAPVIAVLWLSYWRSIPDNSLRRLQLLWPLASLLLAVCVALIFTANSQVRAVSYFGVEAIVRVLAILGWLARLVVGVEDRHFVYPVFEDSSLSTMAVLGGAILLAAIASLRLLLLRRISLEGFALLTFWMLCVPYLQLIPYNTFSLVSDRFLFIAAWPVIMLFVVLTWRLKLVFRIASLSAIALVYCFQTIERPRDWRSMDTLLNLDINAYPGHYLPAALKIFDVQLKNGLYREAYDTAHQITDTEIRNVMVDLVKTDYAVNVTAKSSGNPQDAINSLQDLGYKLTETPSRARWDLPMIYVWGNCRYTLGMQWEDLAAIFPEDGSVRYHNRQYHLGSYRAN